MAVSLISTGIQFPDNSIQTTAAGGGGGSGYSTMVVLTSTTYWTIPAGVTRIRVTAIGGGGGGGSGANGTFTGAPGGGGGGTAIKIWTVVPGQQFYVTIGAGGTGSNALGIDGGTGGATSVLNTTTGVTITGFGGQGSSSTFLPGFTGSGGAASGGDINFYGQTGSLGRWFDSSYLYSQAGGMGGGSFMGGGGVGAWYTSTGVTVGQNGRAYGGGGGGAAGQGSASNYAGSGAPGVVVLEY